MNVLWLDLETYCELDLKEVGAYVYAETAEVLLFAYAIDDDEPQVWDVTEDPVMPDDLYEALSNRQIIARAHNAAFDRTVLNGPKQSQYPNVPLEQWECTMAQALSHALPDGLSDLCSVLQVPEDMSKLKEGKKLVKMFTQPRPDRQKVRRYTRHTHPAEWARFKKYAANDISAMRESHRRMPRWNWNASAIAEWHCDQRINDRGFYVDRALTLAGMTAAVTEKKHIFTRVAEILGCDIKPSQRDKFKDLVEERWGVELENTQKGTYEELIKRDDTPEDLRELLTLAMLANKTSTAKYAALYPCTQADGRFRGGLQFAGARRTRRWGGRKFQGQNLPARGLPPKAEVETYIECLKANTHDLWFDELMRYASAALRGVVIAPPRRKLVVADLSNIEGRMLSWVAGEGWKLKAFRDYDTIVGYDADGKPKRKGPDLYNVTAVSILGGDPWNVPKKVRNTFGKVPDLASGYQGGVSGYQNFARVYGVKMADSWDTIQEQIAPTLVDKAHENYNFRGEAEAEELGISKVEWLASETCKLAWRARHPKTVRFWYDLNDAVVKAIRSWGDVFTVGQRISVRCMTHARHRWLLIKLPSGRYLTYYNPKIEKGNYGKPSITYEGHATEEGKSTHGWVKNYTHGGKMTGNICQGTSRDILAPALMEAEQEGYLPILSVHDEGVCEVPDVPEFNWRGFAEILAKDRGWTAGLPLAADGFEAYRYGKED